MAGSIARTGPHSNRTVPSFRFRLGAAMAVVLLCSIGFQSVVVAQRNRTMGRNGWRWHSTQSGTRPIYGGSRSVGLYGGAAYVNPYYAYGWGYPYYGWGYNNGIQTAYGNAAAARSELLKAQGQAAKAQAEAAVNAEKARAEYLKNREAYLQMRREQKEAIEARKATEREEQQQRAANRTRKKPTDLYDRVSVDQVDPTTGLITWPKSLQGAEFKADRTQLNDLLRMQAENGPSERLAMQIKSAADEMKGKTQPLIRSMGFDTYREARRFLCSLSVEGYYALEEL